MDVSTCLKVNTGRHTLLRPYNDRESYLFVLVKIFHVFCGVGFQGLIISLIGLYQGNVPNPALGTICTITLVASGKYIRNPRFGLASIFSFFTVSNNTSCCFSSIPCFLVDWFSTYKLHSGKTAPKLGLIILSRVTLRNLKQGIRRRKNKY